MEEEAESFGTKVIIYVLLVLTIGGTLATIVKIMQRWRRASSNEVMRCERTDRFIPEAAAVNSAAGTAA